jgi:hypothetical protein
MRWVGEQGEGGLGSRSAGEGDADAATGGDGLFGELYEMLGSMPGEGGWVGFDDVGDLQL